MPMNEHGQDAATGGAASGPSLIAAMAMLAALRRRHDRELAEALPSALTAQAGFVELAARTAGVSEERLRAAVAGHPKEAAARSVKTT